VKTKPAATVPVAILVRISTAKQETARQKHELRSFAESKGWTVVEECEELGISGSASEDERHGLKRVEELAKAGQIKKVLVHEVSRLARRNSIVHKFVETLEELGVSLYWHAQGIETLLPSGKRNPAASIMLALLAEMARNETETLKDRILSGLENARRKGVKLGRPEGTGYDAKRLMEEHKDIVKLLKQGFSVRKTAKLAIHKDGKRKGKAKGMSTVQRVKAAMEA
jgi:DNA invertase Pin-like site-specific DNA recombinase